jgi:hypothetical protein
MGCKNERSKKRGRVGGLQYYERRHKINEKLMTSHVEATVKKA